MGIKLSNCPKQFQDKVLTAMGQTCEKRYVKNLTGPNKTELAALGLFRGDFQHEAKSFDIIGGAKYTPDWIDVENKIAIEVKAEFIHSRDSRRRFDEAKYLFPDWTWIWARQRTKGKKGRRWEIEVYCFLL